MNIYDLLNFGEWEIRNPESGKRVRLYGVTHVAPAEVYESLNTRLAEDHSKGFKIHCEGVQGGDLSGLSKMYRALAKSQGWVKQERPTVEHEVHDANWGQLSLKTRSFLRAVANPLSHLLGSILEMAHRQGVPVTISGQDDGAPRPVMNLLAGVREEIAVEAAMREPGDIAMVWGYAHVSSFLERFEEKGFSEVTHVPWVLRSEDAEETE